MADRKAVERAAAVDGNVNISKSSTSSKPDPNVQGESLFLPYLVEHLRSSLQQQPVPPVRRRRQESRGHTAQQHFQAPQHHSSETGRIEDSGTESGEDLRFLAAGLRDSIELHRQGSSREQDAGQGILVEVQSALSRLHSSLQQGCIGNEQVEPSKQDSLLQLVERLQSSLQLPCAGTSWAHKQMKAADLPPTGGAQGAQVPESNQRFAGRRSNRRTRHTIGVTREELADARRFLEESEMRNKMSSNTPSEDQDKPPDIPPLPMEIRAPFGLIKQSSADDVPTVAFSGTSAFRPYRPTHFLPKKFEEPPFVPSSQFPGSSESSHIPADVTLSAKGSISAAKKPPDYTSEDFNDVETEDEDDEVDSDTNFVEERAVTGKAWMPDSAKLNTDSGEYTNPAQSPPNSTEYDPSSNLFTPSQSVQIAVHKAAINKQLSIEEEKRQAKVVQSETSDEDTMTDASYESLTEKADSDGYEEEDKEDEEEDHETNNARNNAKNNPSEPAKIVRNLTFTVHPHTKENSACPQRVLEKQSSNRGQDYCVQQPSQLEYRQDKNKQHQQNNSKNQRTQIQDNRSSQQNNPKSLDPQVQPPRPKDPPIQNRNINKKQNQVYQDANQTYTETSSKHQQQRFADADQLNGKLNKSSRSQPSKSQSHKEAAKYYVAKGDIKTPDTKTQQDRNNNCPAKPIPSNTDKSATLGQKMIQIEPGESQKSARFANRQLKKQKMKRANTIDIPKPLHHYGVEDDSEVSSDDDSQGSQHKNMHSAAENYKSTNMSTHTSAHNPRTRPDLARQHSQIEHDRRGSAPQKLENKVKKIFEQPIDADNPSYNPQAHLGTQWNNRFANIKTCFENPIPNKVNNTKQADPMSRVRSFWRSTDDSALKVSKNSAFHDPKLTKQSSQFLKKLHEQKEQGEPPPKLPWTSTEHENIVVGSLVVPANLTKNTQPVPHQGPVNKFSHAPMSAFRPIEKKTASPVAHTPWAAPSVTGSVKQIASSKFSRPDLQPPAPTAAPAPVPAHPVRHEPPKPTVRSHVNLPTPSTAPASASPTLPWTKDISHGHNLNSALAKFESMSSRESSPQLMPNALLRSHSQDRVPLHTNFAVFNRNVPAPPPRTYIPTPQTNIVQARAQSLQAPFKFDQGLPLIHEQPHHHPLVHSKSNQYVPQSLAYSGPIKNHPVLEGNCNLSDSDQDEPAPSSSRLVLSTLQGTIDQSHSPNQTTNSPHVQTYSAGVTARQSVYGIVRHPVMAKSSSLPEQRDVHPSPPTYHETHDEPEAIYPPVRTNNAPPKYHGTHDEPEAIYPPVRTSNAPPTYHETHDEPEAIYPPVRTSNAPPTYHETHDEPEAIYPPVRTSNASGDFAQEHTAAVSRVMGQSQCQAAVTVSHKTRRYNEEDEGELGSAAFHLASLLHKFSDTDPKAVNKPLNNSNEKALYEGPKQSAGSNSPAQEHDKWIPPTVERSHQEFPRPPAAHAVNLPPKPEGSPRLTRVDATNFNRTVDPRSRAAPEPKQDRFPKDFSQSIDAPFTSDDNGVYATRFEIPVNKVQSITLKFQSPAQETQNESFEERKPPVSPNPGMVLRKSESWHQLAAQQQGLSRRPQSMVMADLPPVKPRSPNAVPKAKSSHTLAFPKQFEAAIKPEALQKKQKTVEEYFKKNSKTEIKSSATSLVQKQAKARHKTQLSQSFSEKRSYSAESSGLLLLDDNIDNVDEAFESLFNASATDKTKTSSSIDKGSAAMRTSSNRR